MIALALIVSYERQRSCVILGAPILFRGKLGKRSVHALILYVSLRLIICRFIGYALIVELVLSGAHLGLSLGCEKRLLAAVRIVAAGLESFYGLLQLPVLLHTGAGFFCLLRSYRASVSSRHSRFCQSLNISGIDHVRVYDIICRIAYAAQYQLRRRVLFVIVHIHVSCDTCEYIVEVCGELIEGVHSRLAHIPAGALPHRVHHLIQPVSYDIREIGYITLGRAPELYIAKGLFYIRAVAPEIALSRFCRCIRSRGLLPLEFGYKTVGYSSGRPFQLLSPV